MIGIALLTLVPGELGGSETYVRALVDRLAETGELEYLVLAPPAAPDAGGPLPTVVATRYPRMRTIPGRLAAMATAAAFPRPLRSALAAADVVHYPLTIRLPRGVHPCVTTLHDVQHLDLPHMFSRAERAFRAVAWHPSVRRADRVITTSAFVRDRAVARLGLDEAVVRVVPLGIDHDAFGPADVAREELIVYPARPWPHKNHHRLFEAFARVRRRRPDLRLVLTGGGDFGAPPEGVEIRGLVSQAELVSLLRHAAALVFPSLYEGFGLPVLEAMACGCPVACARSGALPEVAGDAARMFDAHDVDAIAEAVDDVLDHPDTWRARGLARAAGFSWDATARETEAVYRELL